jgi:hypothetical protein
MTLASGVSGRAALCAPSVERRVADPVFAAQLHNRDARLVLLQHIDDLLFAAKRGRSRGQGHIPWVLFASSSAWEGALATGGRVPLDGKNAKPGPS